MTYSIIGILATLCLFITNRDILWHQARGELTLVQQKYRLFLLGVLVYYVTDMLWGILDSLGLMAFLYVDTMMYFIAMAAAVMLWTRYVVAYLKEKTLFGTVLYYAGGVFLVFEVIVIAVNLFYPIAFWFDETGAYYAGWARYVTLAVQIVLFMLSSIYTLSITVKTQGAVRFRHRTVGAFGIAMTVLIIAQVFYPLMPFYAMGYMLGTCLLHSFVVEDEKEEHSRMLEEAIARERKQSKELEESREALQDALAAAEQANRAKTAFLSNMSHEIRTPMNAIIGLNNIAMNDPTASDEVKEYLTKIGASAQHLLGIINDILDMSRIESGRMAIKSEEFSFAQLLEQVNTIVIGQCREKGLDYDCHIEGHIDDYYIGDAMKLKQVLINILGNAVKFTPEGGSVNLKVESVSQFDNKETLRFTIADTGIGMSEEYLPHLFEAFSQEDSSSTSRYGSTGLGMPITKSIVELMNGTIDVQSQKGVGTTFTVAVTLDKSENSDAAVERGDFNPHGLNVLVIDDDPIALDHAQILFKQVGISCDVAASGAKGLEMAMVRHGRMDDYDLILVDWKMPEMDGVEVTRQMRSIVGEDTPVIMLTAYSWDEVADIAEQAGVDAFISKPLFAGTILDEFRGAFEKRGAGTASERTDLRGRRILLAEDVPVNAEIIMMMLGTREIEVDLAENGRIAVEKFASSPVGHYDAILMDLRMPEMDGLEATSTIRVMEREDATQVPIIALTANAFDEDVQSSMQAGLNAHLSKPVESEVLFETLESLIKD